MSGDVQPRKRKDKKKKKDEPSTPPFVYVKDEPPLLVRSNSNGAPDELIHVHKESSLGGNICAKIVFFLLLGTLTVMVGLIITEYRGSNEVQTAADTPWSQMLEGWIDDSPADKHEDDHAAIADSGEHEDHDEAGEEEDAYQDDEEDDHEEEPAVYEQEYEARTAPHVASESKVSEEDEDDEGTFDDQVEGNEEEEGEGEDEDEEEDENQADDDDENVEEQGEEQEDDVEEKKIDNLDDDESGEPEDDDDEEQPQSVEKQEEEEEDDEQDERDNVSGEEFVFREIPGVTAEAEDDVSLGNDDGDEEDNSAEIESHTSFHSTDNDDSGNNNEENNPLNDDDEDTNSDEGENENLNFNIRGDLNEDESNEEGVTMEPSKNIDEYEEVKAERETDPSDPERNEDSAEHQTESDDDFEEVMDPAGASDEGEGEEESEGLEPTGVALKFGVGIAIIIVAHVVLVRKWNESDETGANTLQATSTLSGVPRRQTLIPTSIDPSNLIPEPDDIDDYSDEEYDDEEEEEIPRQATSIREALVRNYAKISPGASEDEVEVEEEEEEEEEGDEDVEDEDEDPEQEFDKQYGYKLVSAPVKQDSQGGDEDVEADEGEYNTHGDPWKNIRQHQQNSDPEISDGDELSGSEDEPASTVVRRTGGPKDIESDSDWPVGPDQSSTLSPRDTLNFKAAEAQLEENPEAALKQVMSLLSVSPKDPVLLYLRAQALDKLAERMSSNTLLEQAIAAYLSVLQLDNINDDLFLKTADRCINRMRFRGQHGQAVGVNKMLISRFPKDPKHRNNLAVTYLMVGKVSLAKQVLEESLQIWPSNGVALVHYGFILKTSENNNEEGSRYMQAGIDSKEPGTMDARFLFHLGDSYNRLGRLSDAEQVYELGVKQGLFRSRYQRSLYNVDRLTARPWWTLQQTTYEKPLRKFEEHWQEIRNEGLAILQSQSKTNIFKDEAENLRDKGIWKQLELYARGQQIPSNCKRAPVTCQLISQFPAAQTCRRGQAKFSVMHPNTHVWPHCGPTNCRLRAHLGLVVPSGTELRVGTEKKSWKEGKVFVFDDSFEHEVWHNGTSLRLVLIVDIWHPELTDKERRALPAI